MHFLCLHGMGTNSKVLEAQSGRYFSFVGAVPAALRYALGDNHTYDFAEGVMKTHMHPEIVGFSPEDDDYFQYFDVDDVQSCQNAVRDLEAFVAAEGPFDGVIGFSQGAALAATLMAQHKSKSPIFKCAMFLGAGQPCDLVNLDKGCVRGLSYDVDGEVIHVPTAHIWGQQDPSPYPAVMAQICSSNLRQVYIHEGGHGIPGLQMGEQLKQCARVIRRTIYMASWNKAGSFDA